MLSRIFAITLLMSVSAFAADECAPTVVDPQVISDLANVSSRLNQECPNQLNVPDFCAAVSNPLTELHPSHPSIRYQYQSMVFQAACITPSDTEITIKSKVQNFWNRYHDALACSQTDFNPNNGNILKLAVSRQSNRFIDDAISKWNVGLNHVDSVDNQTVLDYIEMRKRQAGASSTFARTLQRYYDRFRLAGAKHQREL